MSSAETLYAIAFSVYLVFFLLFARFFLWKVYSEKKYWNKRLSIKPEDLVDKAKEMGKQTPFLSILVPARNESLVIENTINHLMSLNYPPGSFEITVVTDEKEALAAEKERAQIISTALAVIEGTKSHTDLNEGQEVILEEVLVSCLSEYALDEYLSKTCQRSYSTDASELLSLDASERLWITRDISLAIVRGDGAPPKEKLKAIVKKHCPHLSHLDTDRCYPACLSVAAPVIASYASFLGGDSERLLRKTIRHTAEASHGLTQDIIMQMTEFIAKRVHASVKEEAHSKDLQYKIERTVRKMHPTTQEVTERVMGEAGRARLPAVRHLSVPWDFDGVLNGVRKGIWVPSTKGRALNWAIPMVNPKTQVCGFYDAESRPDKDVLLYVGYRRLMEPFESRVLQGPVFQVRNFFEMTPFCRIASLYQAVAHDWYLPWLFRTLPFVGGTNVFIEYQLLKTVGGWDSTVLTEDLEFGTRAYLMCEAWPEYLPYPSSEQTPPTFKAFFKQRLRWGTGHLQVVDKLSQEPVGSPGVRRRLRHRLIVKGQVEWVVYQMATFVPPVVLGLHRYHLLDPAVIPPLGRWLLSLFSALYMSFTFYAYRRYKKHVDMSKAPSSVGGKAVIYLQLLLLPLAAFMFPVPYTSALFLKGIGKEPKAWVKTPRTEEGKLVS